MAVRTVGRRWHGDAHDETAEPPGRRDLSRPLSVATVVLALVPLAAALVHALGQWTPVGDNALLAIRARDVLTSNHPLLGTWTSASTTLGFDLNNPGPLQFDLLALPAKLVHREGMAVGVVVLHALAVVGIAVVAWRRAGPFAAAAAMLVVTALAWSMGSDVLVEPWQPFSMILPFVLFLFLVWSLSCGRLGALPWLVGVGSYIVQTHVSYVMLIPALAAWGLLGLVLERRAARGGGDPAAAGPPGRWRRTLVVTAVVAALCWAQPLAEQVFGSGEGNLSRLARAASEGAEPVGFAEATRVVGRVVAMPPWWVRPSFGQSWQVAPPQNGLPPEGSDPPGLGPAALGLAAVGAILALCLFDCRRRGDRIASRAVVTGAVALCGAIVTASRVPSGVFALARRQFAFIWPIAAFLTFAVVLAVARRRPTAGPAAVPLVAATAALTAVVAVLNLPASDQGVSAPAASMPVIRDIGPQLASLRGRDPLLIDDLFAVFADPYGAGVLVELQERDIGFATESSSLGRQIGGGRVVDAEEAGGRLLMATGDAARTTTPPEARRVAFHEGLGPGGRRELAELEDRLGRYLDGLDELPLGPRARRYIDSLGPPILREQSAAGARVDGQELMRRKALVNVALRGMLDVPEPWRGRFERYAELRRRADRDTLAIYLAPAT